VNEDHDHVDKLYKVLSALPEKDKDQVKRSMEVTSAIYKGFLNDLLQDSLQNKAAA